MQDKQKLASDLIAAWTESHGKPCPWDVAVKITAAITMMSQKEKEFLLSLGASGE